jgi:hypothetical protein
MYVPNSPLESQRGVSDFIKFFVSALKSIWAAINYFRKYHISLNIKKNLV